jgi:hypothetical protein
MVNFRRGVSSFHYVRASYAGVDWEFGKMNKKVEP